jgi:hypothetical protein
MVTALKQDLPFDLEQARLDVVQSLIISRVGDNQAVYDARNVLQRFILDHSNVARMFVQELVRRLAAEEKRFDVIVSFGEYGAVLASRLTAGLIEQYGSEVPHRLLEAVPTETGSVTEYRLHRTSDDKGHLFSGKRILYVAPTILPETWPEILRQAHFLRGPQTNGAHVGIATIARIGALETNLPHGLTIEAIVDWR